MTGYKYLGQYKAALDCYLQALVIIREVGARPMEGRILNNVIEAIRQDMGGLPEEQQESYTDTVAGIYQHLADLLLKQNRVLEAQRVLDLLTTQELEVQH